MACCACARELLWQVRRGAYEQYRVVTTTSTSSTLSLAVSVYSGKARVFVSCSAVAQPNATYVLPSTHAKPQANI